MSERRGSGQSSGMARDQQQQTQHSGGGSPEEAKPHTRREKGVKQTAYKRREDYPRKVDLSLIYLLLRRRCPSFALSRQQESAAACALGRGVLLLSTACRRLAVRGWLSHIFPELALGPPPFRSVFTRFRTDPGTSAAGLEVVSRLSPGRHSGWLGLFRGSCLLGSSRLCTLSLFRNKRVFKKVKRLLMLPSARCEHSRGAMQDDGTKIPGHRRLL